MKFLNLNERKIEMNYTQQLVLISALFGFLVYISIILTEIKNRVGRK